MPGPRAPTGSESDDAHVPPPRKPGMPPSPRFVLSPRDQRRFDLTMGGICAGGFVVTVLWSIGSTYVSVAKGGWIVGALLGLAIVLATLGICASWTFRRWLAGLAVVPALVASLGCLALTVSVLLTDWPLRAVFACRRDQFDRIAARVLSGEKISEPFFIGPFLILKATWAENGNPVVCLWTDLAPSGHTGFVRSAPGQPSAEQLLNLWSDRRLDATWRFVSED